MIFSTPYNYIGKVSEKVSDLPSMTVPDQSLTIPELYNRWQRGLPLDISARSPLYDEDASFDNYDDLEDGNTDLVDYHERMLLELDVKERVAKQRRKQQYESDLRDYNAKLAADAASLRERAEERSDENRNVQTAASAASPE